MTSVLLYVFSLVVLFLLGFILCYTLNYPSDYINSGSSHSDVTHVIVSDKTVEELIMGDDD